MKIFDCKVRLKGDVRDEVRKTGVTSAEIRVLKALHGEDGVVEIVPAGEIERNERKERARLDERYGEAPVAAIFGEIKKTSINDEIEIEDDDDDEEDLPVVSRQQDNLESLTQ